MIDSERRAKACLCPTYGYAGKTKTRLVVAGSTPSRRDALSVVFGLVALQGRDVYPAPAFGRNVQGRTGRSRPVQRGGSLGGVLVVFGRQVGPITVRNYAIGGNPEGHEIIAGTLIGAEVVGHSRS